MCSVVCLSMLVKVMPDGLSHIKQSKRGTNVPSCQLSPRSFFLLSEQKGRYGELEEGARNPLGSSGDGEDLCEGGGSWSRCASRLHTKSLWFVASLAHWSHSVFGKHRLHQLFCAPSPGTADT